MIWTLRGTCPNVEPRSVARDAARAHEAELCFPLHCTSLSLVQKEELARKAVSKSHRQRVEELNQLLATTPEHYDLFKISYAGIG